MVPGFSVLGVDRGFLRVYLGVCTVYLGFSTVYQGVTKLVFIPKCFKN